MCVCVCAHACVCGTSEAEVGYVCVEGEETMTQDNHEAEGLYR